MLKAWDKLPEHMKNPAVREYYDILDRKRGSLAAKRVFDVVMAAGMLVILSPVMGVIAVMIRTDSPGPVFYRQERVTENGRKFRIHKFRSMVTGADRIGSLVTVDGDARVTKIGKFIRKYRLDELPQLLDILSGDMSFVGTRPEVPKYVDRYTEEMLATLLLPAGVTSEASIRYKDEAELLDGVEEEKIDDIYVEKLLPGKMKYNLDAIRHFSVRSDLATMFRTVGAVLGKEYGE